MTYTTPFAKRPTKTRQELEIEFNDSYKSNPALVADIVYWARDFQKLDKGPIGIHRILEWVRCQRIRSAARSDKGFIVDNNHARLMAERIMRDYPDLRGYFIIKESHTLKTRLRERVS